MNGVTRDDHNDHIDLGYIQSDDAVINEVTEHDLVADSIEESTWEVNEVTEHDLVADSLEENTWEVHDQVSDDDNYDFSSGNKPDFGDAGLLGRKFSGAKVTSEGPQVEYVNRALGVDATEYTLETAHAVKRYQSENKLKPTGRVDADLYDRL